MSETITINISTAELIEMRDSLQEEQDGLKTDDPNYELVQHTLKEVKDEILKRNEELAYLFTRYYEDVEEGQEGQEGQDEKDMEEQCIENEDEQH